MGPIQTGIFLSGAAKGGFDRIVVSEVDEKIKKAVTDAGGEITINIAGADGIYQEKIPNIEILNPANKDDLEKLVDAAAGAEEFATALPNVGIFKHIVPWMRRAFEKKPDAIRYIYTAENNNHAAEILAKEVGGNFPNTHYLNTVVGKMSGVITSEEAAADKLALLTPGSDRGHLVEEFNNIYISSAPGINSIKTKHLFPKTDLFPFEDAKLYGHNAIHFLLGMFGKLEGCEFMSQLRGNDKLISIGRSAFIDESGAALCKKYKGVDDLFTEAGFKAYVEDLLVRMTNPFLKDAIARVTRDLPRKLSWDDRSVGAMRLVMSQGIKPDNLSFGAALAATELFGRDPEAIKKGLAELWPQPWTDEHDAVLKYILEKA